MKSCVIFACMLVPGLFTQHGCLTPWSIPKELRICPADQEALSGFQPQEEINEHYPLTDLRDPLRVTSGGWATITQEGRLLTLQGDLDESNKWFGPYSKNADALFGKRPQNIFRIAVRTCLLPSQPGFYIEFGGQANDYQSPSPEPYAGGIDAIAQWWSPQDPNPAFLCKEQYGGFCGNVGYHTKIQSNGGFEIARERPENDTNPNRRYTTLKRIPDAISVYNNQFPLRAPMRIRMEVKEKDNQILITSCLDSNADGNWDIAMTAQDDSQPITGYFVPIFRSDWISAEFFEPHIGVLNDSQKSCAD